MDYTLFCEMPIKSTASSTMLVLHPNRSQVTPMSRPAKLKFLRDNSPLTGGKNVSKETVVSILTSDRNFHKKQKISILLV
jgi:hypothetical protein